MVMRLKLTFNKHLFILGRKKSQEFEVGAGVSPSQINETLKTQLKGSLQEGLIALQLHLEIRPGTKKD